MALKVRLIRWRWIGTLLALLALSSTTGAVPGGDPEAAWHYTPNHNFNPPGTYAPRQSGFNLADVSSVAELRGLPPGVRAIVWVGQCQGVTVPFLKRVRPFIGQPNVFGFYLMDNPDPRRRIAGGHLSAPCTTEKLNAAADWIHANVTGAETFIVLMNLSSSATPSFDPSYNPSRLHVDLFGLDPYPCRSELKGCDLGMIDRYVAAATSIGVPPSRMVPIYQAFGGGAWADDEGGTYFLPSAEQERRILSRWGKLVPRPSFDYAYSWGTQRSDSALESSPGLRSVLAIHNGRRQTEE